MFDNIRIVLSHTTHPGNIGAAARAMKTMGLHQLYLVNPRHFPDAQATAMAAGADDILENAVVYASINEALRGVAFTVAMTVTFARYFNRSQNPARSDAAGIARGCGAAGRVVVRHRDVGFDQ